MKQLRRLVIRYWPTLRLRTIIFGILLLVAALPGVGALYLRVYENALVRQTEAELQTLSIAIASSAALDWPSPNIPAKANTNAFKEPAMPLMDLQSASVFPGVTPPTPGKFLPDIPSAQFAAHNVSVFKNVSQKSGVNIMLLDHQSVIAYGDWQGRRFDKPEEIRAAYDGQAATVLRKDSRNTVHWPTALFSKTAGLQLVHTRPIMVRGQVVGVLRLSKAPQDLFGGMYLDRGKIMIGILLILGALVILTTTLARAIVRPIERLSLAAQSIATGRGTVPANPSLPVVEIEALYEQYRGMNDTIASRSRYLRDFAAALSHEFKTPLTGLTGGIELLQDHGAEMDDAKRSLFLGNMAGDADRLNHLLSRLMELAQADLQFPDGQSETDLHEILNMLADGFRSAAFTISVHSVSAAAKARINAADFERIASILIENSKQAGTCEMVITAELDAENIVIKFADDGSGIPAADQARIFEPFFTSKRTAGGSGLGLAIARSLVEANGGALALEQSAVGATFVITMPRVKN
jgi:signal transduction histidine kinase